MNLTAEDKAILAHVVTDPDAWVSHALVTVGEDAVTAKIERWRPHYEAEKDKPDYKNRVERDAIEEELRKPSAEAIAKQAEEDLIQTKMRAIAVEQLKLEGVLTTDGKVAVNK